MVRLSSNVVFTVTDHSSYFSKNARTQKKLEKPMKQNKQTNMIPQMKGKCEFARAAGRMQKALCVVTVFHRPERPVLLAAALAGKCLNRRQHRWLPRPASPSRHSGSVRCGWDICPLPRRLPRPQALSGPNPPGNMLFARDNPNPQGLFCLRAVVLENSLQAFLQSNWLRNQVTSPGVGG